MKLTEENFVQVLNNNQGIIRKVANSYCKNIGDRDDLIQEITIQLWKSWKGYNDTYKISTWIYRIALNVAISFYRKTYRHNRLNQITLEEDAFIDHSENSHQSENIRQLYQFISKLSELNKALILMHLDRYDYEEIASIMGISRTNVSTKISRIKQHLKKEFKLKPE
ncbi:MAG: sigma-70 family RNA polymerase sigma factor [Reichenbachiella sp.]|uniref:RNA polymerase sigma factor n=1 Tax=Reichenbachiella sp. TaxID=2184521 RepID=UPI003266877A